MKNKADTSHTGEEAQEQTNANRLTRERSHPNHWYNRASDLHASAGAVWHAMGDGDEEIAQELGLSRGFSMALACMPVYYLLCGLALEVIMKALLVQRGTPKKQYEIHDLTKLAALLGVSITEPEKDLLNFYVASVVWAGRYPTPKNADDGKLRDYWSLAHDVLMSPVAEIQGIQLHRGNGAGDWDKFTKLWQTYASTYKHR